MPLTECSAQQGIMPGLRPVNKKALLEAISEQAAVVSGLQARVIFDALLQRERLGSTGIGGGIAIPHGKFEGLTRLVGLFARLEKPVDFDSLDGEPVDLVFVLMAPEARAQTTSRASPRWRASCANPSTTAKLRASRDAEAIYALLTQDIDTPKAA